MSRMTPSVWIAIAVGLLAAGSGLALGQDAASAAAAEEPLRRSMWGLIAQGIHWPAYFIFFGSLVLFTLIAEHFFTVRMSTIAPPEQVKRARTLIERRKFRECLDVLRKSSTFFAQGMTAALRHARHGFDAMQEAARDRAAEQSAVLFRRVEYMNMLGNLGPLMGLLGTVYGMIIAFDDLGASGGDAGTSGELARGISLALVNTMLGLALAIVGLGFFGWCRNRVDTLTLRATVQVLDLLEYFRPTAANLGGYDPVGGDDGGGPAPAGGLRAGT